jgi:hypothetical protein
MTSIEKTQIDKQLAFLASLLNLVLSQLQNKFLYHTYRRLRLCTALIAAFLQISQHGLRWETIWGIYLAERQVQRAALCHS